MTRQFHRATEWRNGASLMAQCDSASPRQSLDSAKAHGGLPRGLFTIGFYLTISLRLLRAWALTTLRAGWALKVVGCFVKGLIPSRAGLAGR